MMQNFFLDVHLTLFVLFFSSRLKDLFQEIHWQLLWFLYFCVILSEALPSLQKYAHTYMYICIFITSTYFSDVFLFFFYLKKKSLLNNSLLDLFLHCILVHYVVYFNLCLFIIYYLIRVGLITLLHNFCGHYCFLIFPYKLSIR